MRRNQGNTANIPRLASEPKATIASARLTFFSTTLTTIMTQQVQKFWRYLFRPESSIIQLEKDEVTDDTPTIVNALNVYFQSVFTHYYI